MSRLLAFFRCRHDHISWPQNGTVQCHDCHRRLPYDWDLMRVVPGGKQGTPEENQVAEPV